MLKFESMNIQLVINEKGEKTAVIIPISDWEEIQKRLNTERFYDEFSASIQAIKDDIDGKINLKSAKDLLHGR